MTLIIFGQALTFFSYLVYWCALYIKDKKNMLIWFNVSNILTILSFICLGSLNGIQNTLFSIFRNYCGKKTCNSTRVTKSLIFIMLLLIMITMFSTTFNGLSTIVIFLCSLVNLIGTIFLNEQGIRMAHFIGGIFYSTFMFTIGNYTGTVCELISVVIILISYIIYYIKSLNKGENNGISISNNE